MSHQVRLACALTCLVLASAVKEQSRWSRQISSYTSDISDWVPLPGPAPQENSTPIKRQAVAEPRILSEPFPPFPRQANFAESFPTRQFFQQPTANRQLYLQSVPSVPSAPQNFLSDQGFGQQPIRFGLSQPNFPLSQGFVAPQLGFESFPPQAKRPENLRPQNPIKFESFQKQGLPLPVSPQAKPFITNQYKPKPAGPKFVDGYQIENDSLNAFAFQSNKKKPQSLQKIKFESFENTKLPEPVPTNKAKSEREEVQLLYVPVDSLNRGQFNFRAPSPPALNPDVFSQGVPKPQVQQFASDFQRPVAKPIDNYSLTQDFYRGYTNQLKEIDQVPKYSTISSPFPSLPPTTPKPKKLKPHQPPLAVFLAQEAKKGEKIKVGDVLHSLKNAKTIAVLDTVSPSNAPKVFIGPSSLSPPENFVKFELPYLSNIENSDRMLRQLPFFVAPLSYNTPDGFAKIPFPSPHVGSVIVNSQVKEVNHQGSSTPSADIIPNSYTATPQTYRQDQKVGTKKPTFSYYSTAAPNTNPPPKKEFESTYYSFEPQTVSTLRPKEPEQSVVTAPPKQGSYFLGNNGQYNSQGEYVNYQQKQPNPEPVRNYNTARKPESPSGQTYTSRPQYVSYNAQDQKNYNTNTQEPSRYSTTKQSRPSTSSTTTATSRPTTKKTTAQPSTYPSQLLETHNPYSINQAFHLSTPSDFQTYNYEEGYTTPAGQTPSQAPTSLSTPRPQTNAPEKPVYQPAPKYPQQQNYEQQTVFQEQQPKYQQQSTPTYLQNYSPEIHYESENQNSKYPIYNTNSNEYTTKTDVNADISNPVNTEYSTNTDTQPPTQYEEQTPYKQYVNSGLDYKEINSQEIVQPVEETTPSTTTTTTRRSPIRSRGRPRYTTPKSDSTESTKTVTRRPLRERRPTTARPKYEPNKITTEKPSRRQESIEVTTKSNRSRTRGRVQYKASENEEQYERKKSQNGQDADIAYQRDVLHQNYPVTIQERMSTVDVDAVTEPIIRISSKIAEASTEAYDTEQAFSHEQAFSQLAEDAQQKQSVNGYSKNAEVQDEASYVPKVPAKNEDYVYLTRSSAAPSESSYSDISSSNEDIYIKSTRKNAEPSSYATEPISPVTEDPSPKYSQNDYSANAEEEITTTKPEVEIAKVSKNDYETEAPQTTPTYKVRIRPGIRQYSQSTSTTTESAKPKTDIRKRPVQPVTYRPAFDRRRTTMRIDEIEADLKTKQVRTRPENQDYRHPVYKPESTTEPSATTISTRGQFRRRRPNYTTTSTEGTVSKKANYEVKSRFKGRRPTEKPADKPEAQTEPATSTARAVPYSRYTRPRLSERYNKKPVETETEDQDSNYSINRLKYAIPEERKDYEQWSPKFALDSFKPYSPNDIQEERKPTTERRSDFEEPDDLDIITARNDYDDILVSVTPATNRVNKKLPEIPPTLEAFVEQNKVTKPESDSMSTFETMLEEVMKSLEEQDENEYSSKKVVKHKGGEIGEIPPESAAVAEEDVKQTTAFEEEATTPEPVPEPTSEHEEEKEHKSRRRGFWKKVHVRPVTTESIEAAESQYYISAVNRIGDSLKPVRNVHEKVNVEKAKVTTYKPAFQYIKEIVDGTINEQSILEDSDKNAEADAQDDEEIIKTTSAEQQTEIVQIKSEVPTSTENVSPGELDLGTGSPEPTMIDMFYTPTTTEANTEVSGTVDRSDGFNLMDYLFGTTSNDSENVESANKEEVTERPQEEVSTEVTKSKLSTTENTFMPDEITAVSNVDETTENILIDLKKVAKESNEKKVLTTTERPVVETIVETSSASSFMDPSNVVTSMSTQISHETEICFRGKCIKTKRNVL